MSNVKKLMLSVAGLALALGCTVAFSQSENGSQDQTSQGSLEEMKQKMAQRIQDRIGKMQQSLDCVHNAQDKDSLQACMPEKSGRSGMKRGGWGGSGSGDGGSGY
jgi:hypothetical protein